MRLERLSKTDKAARAAGRATAIAQSKLGKAGTKGKEFAKKHAPAVKAAAKSAFYAGLAFAKKQLATKKKRRKSRKHRKRGGKHRR